MKINKLALPKRPQVVNVQPIKATAKRPTAPKAPKGPSFLSKAKGIVKKTYKALSTDNHSQNYTRIGTQLYKKK